MRLSSDAMGARVFDLEGRAHPLSELWSLRPSVLVFLRKFG